jgi:hypothetical protein
MGSGYIQLIAVGSEINIFNYNPNISFFKIYYRRHTNFFINNMDINGNSIQFTNLPRLTTNSITINIPKNGDLLSKSYLNLNVDEHYFELFKYNDQLGSTLNINLLNVYDSYYIKANNYSIDDIETISIIKINYIIKNGDNQKIYLSIVSSNLFNQNELMNYIGTQNNISLQTDNNHIFLNINLNLLFYGFNIIISKTENILNNTLFLYIINNIIYKDLSYVQIDFKSKNIATRIKYSDIQYYEILLKLLLKLLFVDDFIDFVNEIKIDINYVYISLNYTTQLFDLLFDLFYVNSEIFKLEIIDNKNELIKKIFLEKNYAKIINLISNKNNSTTIYLSILNDNFESYSILTVMKDVSFFGNLTNEYYNDVLISNSNLSVNLFNLTNVELSLNLLIKIYVSLMCYNTDTSIQNYLQLVNNNKTINLFNIIKYYLPNIDILNNKLIEYIMDPDVLIVNKKSFYVILYSKNIYEKLQLQTYVKPFTNNIISKYTNIMINYYFNYFMLISQNNVYNNISNDNSYQTILLSFLNNITLTQLTLQSSVADYQQSLNYIENNNMFDILSSDFINTLNAESSSNKYLFFNYLFQTNDYKIFFIQSIINNGMLTLITQSIKFIYEQINYISDNYNSNGSLSKIFINSNISQVILPFSSSIYVLIDDKKNICNNEDILNSNLYFNRELNKYLFDIEINLITLIEQLTTNIKTNILNFDYSVEVKKYIGESQIKNIATNYYKNIDEIMKQINISYVNSYLEEIKNINYSIIYPNPNFNILNINKLIMNELFLYTDKNIFNNSFSNFLFNKYDKCNENLYETNFQNETNYEKFIFTINSPLYRIYFYFTLIANITIDSLNLDIQISDDINTLRDLTFVFILYFLIYFNQIVINSVEINKLIDSFKLNKIENIMYYIKSNFFCFDEINIFNNDFFLEILKNKNSNKYSFIYNNFYFIKKNFPNLYINNYDFINNIPEICDNFNYNYDDMIVGLYFDIIIDNRDKFVQIDKILKINTNFFNKKSYSPNEFKNDLLDLYSGMINNDIFDKNNEFYYKCYYTSYIIGSTFDNINTINTNLINETVNLIQIFNNKYLFRYNYNFIEYNIKQNSIFLDLNENIINVFKYFKSKLFIIFKNKTYVDENYLNNYLNVLTSYTNNNLNYLILYILSKINFNNAVQIINKYVNIFNENNNTNITLFKQNILSVLSNSTNTLNNNLFGTLNSTNDLNNNLFSLSNSTNASNNNYLTIVYYYIYFIYKCMNIDVNKYNLYLYNLNVDFINGINVDFIKTFDEYIIYKYSSNIYEDCIDDLINLFFKTNYNIQIDFSKIYFNLENKDILLKNNLNNLNNQGNYFTSEKYIYNVLKNNEEIYTIQSNLSYSQYNYYEFNNNNNYNFRAETINKNFNLMYCNIIENIISKSNKLFYLLYIDNDLSAKTLNDDGITLNIKFDINLRFIYDDSIFYLKEIYNNLYKSNILIEYNTNSFKQRIVNYIFINLNNFFNNQNLNYFNTLFNKNYNNPIKSLKSFNDKIEQNLYNKIITTEDYNVIINDLNEYVRTTSVYLSYTIFINALISNSLIYENVMNKVIYLLCTNYLISNSFDKNYTRNILHEKTLYDIVKLYISIDDNNMKNEKKYLTDTSIYSNQPIFQIYNYENMQNNISFSQNFWINEIISGIDIEINEPNSYYNLYLRFVNYVNFFELELVNFALDDGILILGYFQDVNNYDEFLNLIFNYICLNDYYSPNLIFIDIINLIKTNFISSKLTIETNYLKKKILIYIFFTWIIFNNTAQLLIANFKVDKKIILEYNLEQNIVDIELEKVLNYQDNMEIINWIIYEIYNMEPTIDNKNLTITNYPIFLLNYNELLNTIKRCKIVCSPIIYFNLMSDKYINSYNEVIGNSNIYNDKLIILPFNPTLTNLVSNINIIFNNDININNQEQYDLTFYSLKLLDINFTSEIYDLNNTTKNMSSLSSVFTQNAKLTYEKNVINDFNLLYNLSCLLLNNYSINYSNLNNYYIIVQNNLRKSVTSINSFIEIFKGYISSYMLSNQLTGIINDEKYDYFSSKLFNIQKLDNIVSEYDNLSIITPNDYDTQNIMTNYNYINKKFYLKYYLYNFNYNNFKENYKVIYKKLYIYYTNIVSNITAIKNIKNFNMNLYIWLFVDLINSFISNIYYDTNSNNINSYFDTINQIIKIYFTYNYSFRINSNISNTKNLSVQKKYSNIKTFNTYIGINNFLLSYYYYQLFSTDINDDNVSQFKQDVILFFNTLNIKSNINFIYIRNFLNCILKFETIIRFIGYKIKYIFNVNTVNDNFLINKSTSIIIEYMTNIDNIINFFNTQYINKENINQTNSFYKALFNIINNLVEPVNFYTKFIYSLSELLYWINNYSYDTNVLNTWTKYFSNVYFEYYQFVIDDYVINKYKVDIFEFYYLIYNYIYFILSENTEYFNNLNNIYIGIYENLFINLDSDSDLNLIINPDIINDILSLKYNNLLFANNDTSINFFINKQDVGYNIKISNCINNILKHILNNMWGIINYDIIENTPQINIRSNITFYNLYYSYLNYLVINENSDSNNYDFEYYSDIFDELYILYLFMINIYTIQYINDETYFILEQQYLTLSHQYIFYGIKINTLDLNSNFAVLMDNINSNIIPNNFINNYYKNIQNNTIYNSQKYKLNSFKNNTNNYNDYIINIFNNQLIVLNLIDENGISSNTFYNIIINTFSNLTSNVKLYYEYNIIFDDILNSLFDNINIQFNLISNTFGGTKNSNLNINNSILNSLFNTNNYKNENSQITIFSIITEEILKNKIYNNVPIFIFYYACYITWCTLGINVEYDLDLINELFYGLANIINRKIISFLNNQDKINTDIFFEGLDILLFNNYNNYEFIEATKKYFNLIISTDYSNISNSNINNLININNLLTNNINTNPNKNNIFELLNLDKNDISLLKLKNNKIINYKYLLGLVCDINESKLIYYIKSIDNVFNDLMVQEKLVNYIIKLCGGLINNYGIIQIINKIILLFDDEIISQYFNLNYKIFIDNFQNINKQELLNDMLGINDANSIITGIKPYIKFSYNQNFQIPIKFFFENYFNSIPLISCMNTDIKITVYFNDSYIYKNSYFINYFKPININTKLNSDFILLERDERIKLSTTKIDNLIERNNYFEFNKNINEFDINRTEIFDINFDFELDNLVKEIIWTFKITIDKYQIEIYKNFKMKQNFFNNFQNITLDDLNNSNYDFIINTKFYLNGLRRDGIVFLDANVLPNYNKITTILNPYKYNTKVNLDKNYNTYSFALEPTDFQPTGAVNMSNYKSFRIQIQIDKLKFFKYLNNINELFNLKDINFKILLTTYEYNIVRYQSSLAGLLFIS